MDDLFIQFALVGQSNRVTSNRIHPIFFVYSSMKKINFLFWVLFGCLPIFTHGQNATKAVTTQKELFDTIASLDSSLFEAYNAEKLDVMKTFFTEDLEWYQDNGGLIGYHQVFQNFKTIFDREYTLTRTLLRETLEVHPIQGFGAIEIGKHQFSHLENGRMEVGTFQFLMIWKLDQGKWKISRVVSYDH